MHEILRSLEAGDRVLDLGCDEGSFPASATRARVVRLDRDLPGARDADFVRGDAGAMPFADGSFAAVISNHSMEHFTELERVLGEVRRVLRSGGALFVAVPDAGTLTDKLYRWLGKGGGHVNAFTSAEDTARRIERGTGLRCVATRTLWSSLSFMNRRYAPRPLPRRLWLVGGGFEWTLRWYVRTSRRIDRWFGTRAGVYGWAFYFGEVQSPVDTTGWENVCIRCGSGWQTAELKIEGREYRCPTCATRNPLC
jgi:SAM-dependent methyltransferase